MNSMSLWWPCTSAGHGVPPGNHAENARESHIRNKRRAGTNPGQSRRLQLWLLPERLADRPPLAPTGLSGHLYDHRLLLPGLGLKPQPTRDRRARPVPLPLCVRRAPPGLPPGVDAARESSRPHRSVTPVAYGTILFGATHRSGHR